MSPSGSVKAPATGRLMAAPSALLCAGVAAVTLGAGLVTVQVKVSLTVPPWPSLAVTATL